MTSTTRRQEKRSQRYRTSNGSSRKYSGRRESQTVTVTASVTRLPANFSWLASIFERCQKALGHDSVATTEKYYGAWCKRQQQSLDDDVRASWQKAAKKKVPEAKRPDSSVPPSTEHDAESVIPDTAYRVQ